LTTFVAATAYACGCADVGCASVLTVDVTAPDGSRPAVFSGTVFVGTSSLAFACPGSSAGYCEPGHITTGLPAWAADADTVGLELDGGDSGSYSGQLALETEDWSPDNGPFCGPTCARASGAVTLRP
jgi:hypothetical protein